MYITEVTTNSPNGKSYKAILLRESYREGGKVKNRTIANLTKCKPEEIAAIRLALEHKDDLSIIGSMDQGVELMEGKSIGAAWTVYQTAKSLGIEKALGTDEEGKLALWQVMARVIDQGSRLSAVRLAQTIAGPDILGISKGFCEDDLYKNLAWLASHQRQIEHRLFQARSHGKKPELFLYDVTSSYFEGEHNELADWGYNRDKKRGKKQVVIGLMCDESGQPITIEVFTGNTSDLATLSNQIKRVAQTYGCQRVTFVGDRGMIKSGQIKALESEHFHYITAITKPQIESLIKAGIFQMSLFDEKICEVESNGVRYLLRRNPQRVEDMAHNRQEKTRSIEKFIELKNSYLDSHPKASIEVALRKVTAKVTRLKLSYLKVEATDRKLELRESASLLAEQTRLDGCYVIKTDLPKEVASTQIDRIVGDAPLVCLDRRQYQRPCLCGDACLHYSPPFAQRLVGFGCNCRRRVEPTIDSVLNADEN
jgi:DDE family transposase